MTEHRTPETLAKLREAEKLKKELEKKAYFNPEIGEKAREEGNALFKKNDWPGAVAKYSEAIKRNEQDYKSYSNRAACYLKLMALNEALKDAEKCIEIEPTFSKSREDLNITRCYSLVLLTSYYEFFILQFAAIFARQQLNLPVRNTKSA